jgi:hypothetical protein
LTGRNDTPVGWIFSQAIHLRREQRESLPGEDDETGPDVGIYDSPHESLELEDDVGDVEYGQQPAVSVAFEIQVCLHAGDFSIADIRAIEEGKKICHTIALSAQWTYHIITIYSVDNCLETRLT